MHLELIYQLYIEYGISAIDKWIPSDKVIGVLEAKIHISPESMLLISCDHLRAKEVGSKGLLSTDNRLMHVAPCSSVLHLSA